jgi:5-methylcytosine-specific restriction endonuclease McrA
VNRPTAAELLENPTISATTPQYRTLRKRLLAQHRYCHICRKPFTDPTDPPELDHIRPRALGGTSKPSNLLPAHRSCNGKKARRGAKAREAGSAPLARER